MRLEPLVACILKIFFMFLLSSHYNLLTAPGSSVERGLKPKLGEWSGLGRGWGGGKPSKATPVITAPPGNEPNVSESGVKSE